MNYLCIKHVDETSIPNTAAAFATTAGNHAEERSRRLIWML
jgi:hypothetical protein